MDSLQNIHPLTKHLRYERGMLTKGWIRFNGLNMSRALNTIYNGYCDPDTIQKLKADGLYDYLPADVRECIEALKPNKKERKVIGTRHFRFRTIDQLKEHLLKNRVINPETECWEWTRGCNVRGYGAMSCRILTGKSRPYGVHRISAALWMGFDLCSALLVCHHCDNPPCFNPEHLYIGTTEDNIADASLKGRMGKYKVEKEKIIEAIALLKTRISVATISRKLDIPYSVISGLKSGITRKHLARMHDWHGDKTPYLKIKDEDVAQIKYLLAQGHSQASIAKVFNIHYSTVSRINAGQRRYGRISEKEAVNGN